MMTKNVESAVPQTLFACYSDMQNAGHRTGTSTVSDTIELKIPGETRYVCIARQAVDAITEEIHLSIDDRAAVRLAVGEACNNAVRYSESLGVSKASPVFISFRVDEEALEIDVANSGSDILPSLGAKMPDPLSESGRGVALIEAMMDSVEVQATKEQTVVRMRKVRHSA